MFLASNHSSLYHIFKKQPTLETNHLQNVAPKVDTFLFEEYINPVNSNRLAAFACCSCPPT